MPPGRTSIIVGFNIIIRIFTLLGEIITLQRETRRVPPVGPEALVKKLREVGTLMIKTIGLLHDSPPAFQIRKTFNSAANSPAAGWEEEAKSQLNSYFFDPTSSKKTAKDAFLVSQGNVFITHALTRFMLLSVYNHHLWNRPRSRYLLNLASLAYPDHSQAVSRRASRPERSAGDTYEDWCVPSRWHIQR